MALIKSWGFLMKNKLNVVIVITATSALMAMVGGGLARAQSSTPREETWVTDTKVIAIARTEDTVYIGGYFNQVGSVERNHIAHILANGSVDLNWDPNANGSGNNTTVLALAVDGSTVYAGGSFSSIGGQTRNRIAALNATTGIATAWNPNISRHTEGHTPSVFALEVGDSTVYAGGRLTTIGGTLRPYFAQFDFPPENSVQLPWHLLQ
jgi:hypothetical protein